MSSLMEMLTLLLFICLVQGEVLDLGQTASWVVSSSHANISVPATVPGGVYSDLRQAGVLNQELYYRFNDVEYRWVGDEDWTYTGQFQLSSSQLEAAKIELDCEGLDTVAEVSINGIHIGNASNMFVRYIWDVKAALLEGTPTSDPQITEHTLVFQFQ